MKKILNSKIISFWTFITILIISIINVAYTAISIYNNPTTSFPWTTAFNFPGVIYIVPLILSLCVHLYLMRQFFRIK